MAIIINADVCSANSRINIPKAIYGTEQQYAFFTSLLSLALQKTEAEYGTVTMVVIDTDLVQGRQLKLLDSRTIDVLWTVTSVEREANYLAIYHPLILGLFGYRVFLLNKNMSTIIGPDTSLDQIRQLSSVQGRDWPDAKILRDNGFNNVESDYTDAFRLLRAGFVQYFPRGVSEVNEELQHHPDLVLEPNHVLVYPNMMYFFVRRTNSELAQRIELGLQKAQTDGTYRTLLNQTPFIQQAETMLKNRRIHYLEAPVTAKTKAEFKKLRQP